MVTISVAFVRQVLDLPTRQVWTDYDAEADVLYISFRKPQGANDSLMQEDGSIHHYDGETLVGMTILNASKREESHA